MITKKRDMQIFLLTFPKIVQSQGDGINSLCHKPGTTGHYHWKLKHYGPKYDGDYVRLIKSKFEAVCESKL